MRRNWFLQKPTTQEIALVYKDGLVRFSKIHADNPLLLVIPWISLTSTYPCLSLSSLRIQLFILSSIWSLFLFSIFWCPYAKKWMRKRLPTYWKSMTDNSGEGGNAEQHDRTSWGYVLIRSVTPVSDIKCYRCVQNGPVQFSLKNMGRKQLIFLVVLMRWIRLEILVQMLKKQRILIFANSICFSVSLRCSSLIHQFVSRVRKQLRHCWIAVHDHQLLIQEQNRIRDAIDQIHHPHSICIGFKAYRKPPTPQQTILKNIRKTQHRSRRKCHSSPKNSTEYIDKENET